MTNSKPSNLRTTHGSHQQHPLSLCCRKDNVIIMKDERVDAIKLEVRKIIQCQPSIDCLEC